MRILPRASRWSDFGKDTVDNIVSKRMDRKVFIQSNCDYRRSFFIGYVMIKEINRVYMFMDSGRSMPQNIYMHMIFFQTQSHYSNTKGLIDGQKNLLYGDRISNISPNLPGQDAGSPEQSQEKKMSVPESPDDIDVFLKEVLMHTADSAKATNRTTLPTNSPPRRRRKLSPSSSPISGERHRVLHSTPDSAGSVSSLIRRVLHPKRAHIQPTSVIETKEVCPYPELQGINADNPKLLTQVTQTQIIDVSIHDSRDSMKR